MLLSAGSSGFGCCDAARRRSVTASDPWLTNRGLSHSGPARHPTSEVFESSDDAACGRAVALPREVAGGRVADGRDTDARGHRGRPHRTRVRSRGRSHLTPPPSAAGTTRDPGLRRASQVPRTSSREFKTSGSSEAWYRARFGTEGSEVQILSPRPTFLRRSTKPFEGLGPSYGTLYERRLRCAYVGGRRGSRAISCQFSSHHWSWMLCIARVLRNSQLKPIP
jgi:hypothetical protein